MSETVDPNPPTPGQVVAAGREAWQDLKRHRRRSFDQWAKVAAALDAGRKLVLGGHGYTTPSGRRWAEAFGPWLKENGFDDIGDSVRSRLKWLHEHIDEVTTYYNGLDATTQMRVGHPMTLHERMQMDGKLPLAETVTTGKKKSTSNNVLRLRPADESGREALKTKTLPSPDIVWVVTHHNETKTRGVDYAVYASRHAADDFADAYNFDDSAPCFVAAEPGTNFEFRECVQHSSLYCTRASGDAEEPARRVANHPLRETWCTLCLAIGNEEKADTEVRMRYDDGVRSVPVCDHHRKAMERVIDRDAVAARQAECPLASCSKSILEPIEDHTARCGNCGHYWQMNPLPPPVPEPEPIVESAPTPSPESEPSSPPPPSGGDADTGGTGQPLADDKRNVFCSIVDRITRDSTDPNERTIALTQLERLDPERTAIQTMLDTFQHFGTQRELDVLNYLKMQTTQSFREAKEARLELRREQERNAKLEETNRKLRQLLKETNLPVEPPPDSTPFIHAVYGLITATDPTKREAALKKLRKLDPSHTTIVAMLEAHQNYAAAKKRIKTLEAEIERLRGSQ